MAGASTLHQFLSTNSWNLKNVRDFLRHDNSSINETNNFRSTPLTTVLMKSSCSIDIVRLLLQYGAKVKIFNYQPLLTALDCRRDEAIIAALIEKAGNIVDPTPLRCIFSNSGFGKRCLRKPEWKENVLNLLLRAGLDLNTESVEGRSPLCFALWEGADVHEIELLLEKGGSLNACKIHASPFHCVTRGYSGALLKANVVQLLIDKQAHLDEALVLGLEPLLSALRRCQYETNAIRLLLEHSDENAVNTWIQQSEPLHWVVKNAHCQSSIVTLFIRRGACVCKLNAQGETPLHSAMRFARRDLSVIDVLLRSGVPVNVKCKDGYTPLFLAVYSKMGNRVINLLLAYGASFSIIYDNPNQIYLENLQFSSVAFENEYILNLLLKYYFLENPCSSIQSFPRGSELLNTCLAEKWDHELQIMELLNVRSGCSLRRFISENFLRDVKTSQETEITNHDFKQLFKILSRNEFPEYFDIVASKIIISEITKAVLNQSLRELIVYTIEHGPVKKTVVLTYDCVCKLALFLSDDELLRLIVAFYQANDLQYNENVQKKRNLDSKQLTNFQKRTKL